jgi:5-methyltetrahydrofolate--homocysteine methyltransferase
VSTQSILESLLSERILVLDGAMATQLQRQGLGDADFRGERFKSHSHDLAGNYDVLSLTRPDLVTRVHFNYLDAGSDLIQTNTFSSTSIAQADYGLSSLAYEMNVTAARLAKAATDTWTARTPHQPRFAAGTIGPTDRSLLPATGPMAARMPGITFDRLKDAYTEQARGLIDGGCDLLLVETVFDAASAAAALAAIDAAWLACARRLPVMVSATVSAPDGRNLAGQTIETFWTTIRQAQPFSVGLNCSSGARAMRPHLEALARVADCFVSCHPSAGLPDASGQYQDQPADLAELLRGFASSRLVNIVGGCCGTTPDHIKAIVEAVRDVPPRATTGRRPRRESH